MFLISHEWNTSRLWFSVVLLRLVFPLICELRDRVYLFICLSVYWHGRYQTRLLVWLPFAAWLGDYFDLINQRQCSLRPQQSAKDFEFAALAAFNVQIDRPTPLNRNVYYWRSESAQFYFHKYREKYSANFILKIEWKSENAMLL